MSSSDKKLIVYKNALETIGNTPLALLSRIHNTDCHIWAKLEFMNPGGSIKDRAAKRIIEQARLTGKLLPKQPVIEMTSGNMGAGLAIVCSLLGHPFTAVMSEGNSLQRVAMLKGLGANVVLVPQITGEIGKVTGEDIYFATQEATRIADENHAFYVNQFYSQECVNAHYYGTGSEILDALDHKVDAFVACVGSGGTFLGTAKRLKEENPQTLCCVVEPENSEILAGKSVTEPQHIMQGVGYSIIPPLWDSQLADKFFAVSDKEVKKMQYEIAIKEGYFVGYSSAGNIVASIKLAESGLLKSGSHIVTILCDTGLKYSF
jgi:cysteine synthase A